MSSNVKKLFVKLYWLKSYWAVNFLFFIILFYFVFIISYLFFCHFGTIFRNLTIFRMSYLRNQIRFSETFWHLSSSLSSLSNMLTCCGISWKLIFTVSLMTSFSRQKPLKSKIQKNTIVGNTKFYYRQSPSSNGKKIVKLDWKRSRFDDSWPALSYLEETGLRLYPAGKWGEGIFELTVCCDIAFLPRFLKVLLRQVHIPFSFSPQRLTKNFRIQGDHSGCRSEHV